MPHDKKFSSTSTKSLRIPSQILSMSLTSVFRKLVLGKHNDKRRRNTPKRLPGDGCAILCATCVDVLCRVLEPSLLENWRWPDDYVIHHTNYKSLKAAANVQGCEICVLLLDSFNTLIKARYPHARDIASILKSPLHDELSFTLNPWTCSVDSEVAPFRFGLERLQYDVCNPRGGRPLHLLVENISLSVERLAGDVPTILGREIAQYPQLHLATEWLENCRKWHTQCPKIADHDLPTRLIDVGLKQSDGNEKIILREGLKRKARYLALSHCWGAREPPLLLKAANKDQLLDEIPFDCLAKNFQDAVTVTRALGFRYLWIDTLCIIQDSREDWEHECTRMESVYANAALTIAAVDAEDAYAGFLHERHRPDEQSSPVPIELVIGNDILKAQISKRHNHDAVKRLSGALDLRGWAMQERLISARVLYFTKQKMVLICNTSAHHESLHYPLRCGFDSHRHKWLVQHPQRDTETELKNSIREYYEIVSEYTKCSLTKVSDRLPAFSAIARRYHERTGDTYLAGIWQNSVATGLAWTRRDPRVVPENLGQTRTVPSWSWASCGESVRYSFLQEALLTLDEACVTLKGLDEFGDVRSGWLKVNGVVTEATLIHLPGGRSCVVSGEVIMDAAWAYCTCDDPERCAGKAEDLTKSEEKVKCLFIGTERSRTRCHCLILTSLESEHNTFRRIGLATGIYPSTTRDIDWAKVGSRQTLYLV